MKDALALVILWVVIVLMFTVPQLDLTTVEVFAAWAGMIGVGVVALAVLTED